MRILFDAAAGRTRCGSWFWRGARCVAAVAAAGLWTSLACAAEGDILLGFAAGMGGAGQQYGAGIAVDSEGGVIVTGVFQGTVDFDPGPGDFMITSATFSPYVCKLDAAGQFIWAGAMSATSSGLGEDVAVDSQGNIYLTGYFRGSLDLDPGPGAFVVTSAGGDDAYVCKLSPSGSLLWVSIVGGPGIDRGYGIAVDGADNVLSTGEFSGRLDFDPGAGSFELSSAGSGDAFVVKLDSSGALVWAGALGGPLGDVGHAVVADSSGSVVLTGRFEGTSDFDPGSGVFDLVNAGRPDAFVCKLDPSGGFEWAGAVGGSGVAKGRGIAVDLAGNVYGTGLFEGTADLDPGSGVHSQSAAGNRDAFVFEVNSVGVFAWAGVLGGADTDYGESIAASGNGDVYIAGVMSDNADLDPGSGEAIFRSAGFTDAFVVKLDPAGALEWAKAAGGSVNDQALDVTIDGGGGLYSSGFFGDVADFDPGAGVFELSGDTIGDIFAWKLEPQSLPVALGDSGQTLADYLMTALSPSTADSLLDNDSDANVRAVLTVIAHDATSVRGAAVLVNGDGTFVYDPTGVGALQAIAPGDSVTDSFTYTISDGVDTAVGTVTIRVYGPGTQLPLAGLWGIGILIGGIGVAGVFSVARRGRI